MEDIRKIFAFGFEIWAKLNGITQEDVAGLLGKDQTTISNYFTGKTSISKANIKFIKDHYSLNNEEILNAGREVYAQKMEARGKSIRTEPTNLTAERHRSLVDKFQQKELALEINEELLALEGLDHGQLKEILGIIKDRKFRLEQEAAKKRPAANGEE